MHDSNRSGADCGTILAVQFSLKHCQTSAILLMQVNLRQPLDQTPPGLPSLRFCAAQIITHMQIGHSTHTAKATFVNQIRAVEM